MKLPESTIILKFGYAFNQAIDNILNDNIKELIFGYSFNQEINMKLPKNI